MAWLQKLLPQQKVQGDHAIQIGKIKGELHVHNEQSTQIHHHNHSHLNTYQHGVVFVVNQPAAPPPPPEPVLQEFHVELLSFMGRHPSYKETGQRFMQREFGTTRVQKLDSKQCHRTTRYMEVCIERDAAKMESETS